jgi:protein-L-isoaspartate(D-aspartate) O-methyltransferase
VDDQATAAIHRVARDHYLRTQDGRQLPQTSKPELIATMLRLPDVQPDHRVLEVGTGSGYSTAVLAHLVGPRGQVISLDIDPHMVTRASRLLALDGHTNVTVVHADDRGGHPPGAPYDRLVAWAQAPQAVLAAWTEQVRPGGIIVAPLQRRTAQVVRLRVLSTHQTGGGAADRCRLHPPRRQAPAAVGRRQPRAKLITAPTRPLTAPNREHECRR